MINLMLEKVYLCIRLPKILQCIYLIPLKAFPVKIYLITFLGMEVIVGKKHVTKLGNLGSVSEPPFFFFLLGDLGRVTLHLTLTFTGQVN